MITIDELFEKTNKDFNSLEDLNKLDYDSKYVIKKETNHIIESCLTKYLSTIEKKTIGNKELYISNTSLLEINRLKEYKLNNTINNQSEIIPILEESISILAKNKKTKEILRKFYSNTAINCTNLINNKIKYKNISIDNAKLYQNSEKFLNQI